QGPVSVGVLTHRHWAQPAKHSTLDDRRHPLPPRRTDGDQPPALASLGQQLGHVRQNPPARGRERVPRRQRAALHIVPPAIHHPRSPALPPCHPAAPPATSPLPLPPLANSLAMLAKLRPPVAAKGCPAASDPPFTLRLLRSIAPSGASSPRRVRQYSSSSQAL